MKWETEVMYRTASDMCVAYTSVRYTSLALHAHWRYNYVNRNYQIGVYAQASGRDVLSSP